MMKKVIQTLFTLLLSTTVSFASPNLGEEEKDQSHTHFISYDDFAFAEEEWNTEQLQELILSDIHSYLEVENVELVASKLSRFSNLQKLGFSRQGMTEITEKTIETLTSAIQNLTHLHTLELWFMGISGDMAFLRTLPSTLTHLDLNGNDLKCEGAQALALNIPSKLQTLILENASIPEEGLRNLITALPHSLEELNLLGNFFDKSMVDALTRLTNLRVLKLNYNSQDGSANILASGITSLSQLEKLTLLLTDSRGILNVIQALPHGVQELILSSGLPAVNDEETQVLIEELPQNLQLLGLGGCEIGDKSIPALITYISNNQAFENLVLQSGSKIDDRSMQALLLGVSAGISHLKSLNILGFLDFQKIEKPFSILKSNTTLEHLNLPFLSFQEGANEDISSWLEVTPSLQKLLVKGNLTENNQKQLQNNKTRARTLRSYA
ncbi:MAG: hypothetical protein BGO76_05280 [Caedibacter sp. 38-128]|nr:hypothetical protein [Holosporales bacterium]OJX03463.1 MAG: hypothetical protein BGO76_05280 [Caedibacter sp. 38-128]